MQLFKENLKNLEFNQKPNKLTSVLTQATTENPWIKYLTEAYTPDALFIHIPKTASTSILRLFGFRVGHVPLARYYSWDAKRADDAFKFAFVRNPWLRMRSGYFFLQSEYKKLERLEYADSHQIFRRNWIRQFVIETDSFEEFTLNLKKQKTRKAMRHHYMFRPQIDWIRIPGDKRHRMDFLGRMESLYSDVTELRSLYGIGDTLGHHRATPVQPAQFNPEMIDVIGDFYAEDISTFRYSESDLDTLES